MMIVGSKYAVLLSWPVLAALIIFGHNLIVTWVDTRHTDAVALLVILAGAYADLAAPVGDVLGCCTGSAAIAVW